MRSQPGIKRMPVRLVTQNPTDSWYELGGLYEKLGMYQEAGDAFAQASSLLSSSAFERAP